MSKNLHIDIVSDKDTFEWTATRGAKKIHLQATRQGGDVQVVLKGPHPAKTSFTPTDKDLALQVFSTAWWELNQQPTDLQIALLEDLAEWVEEYHA